MSKNTTGFEYVNSFMLCIIGLFDIFAVDGLKCCQNVQLRQTVSDSPDSRYLDVTTLTQDLAQRTKSLRATASLNDRSQDAAVIDAMAILFFAFRDILHLNSICFTSTIPCHSSPISTSIIARQPETSSSVIVNTL
jgi:hypothetical protein